MFVLIINCNIIVLGFRPTMY